MPSIGRGCHELRVADRGHEWRIVYRVDGDVIVIGDVFEKKTQKTRGTPSNAAGSVWRRTIMLYGKGRNDEGSEATALGEGWLEGRIGQGLPWTYG